MEEEEEEEKHSPTILLFLFFILLPFFYEAFCDSSHSLARITNLLSLGPFSDAFSMPQGAATEKRHFVHI
jgi:hypothetical protein